MSAARSPTEGLSELEDHFIQPFVPIIPTYIKDTQDSLHMPFANLFPYINTYHSINLTHKNLVLTNHSRHDLTV